MPTGAFADQEDGGRLSLAQHRGVGMGRQPLLFQSGPNVLSQR